MDFIEEYPNALPDDLCDRLVKIINEHQGAYQGRIGGGVDLAKKNSIDLMLDEHPEFDSLKAEILQYTISKACEYFEKYCLALVGSISVTLSDENGVPLTITPENFDEYGKPQIANIIAYLYRSGSVNIQKYCQGEGGYPHWHSEQYPQLGGHEPLHRVLLYMFYLNDVEEGGETEFYYQQRKLKPKKGKMVIAPAGFTHSHRGNLAVSGDKYIATSWIMFNRAEKIYSTS